MPRGDRTGPRGMGARTGRAVGLCAGSNMPGYANQVSGRWLGRGFGRGGGFGGRGFGSGGRGWRNWFHATGIPGWMRLGGNAASVQNSHQKIEQQALKNQAEILQTEMDAIKKRLDEMETQSVKEQK